MIIFTSLLASAVSLFSFTPATQAVVNTYPVAQRTYVNSNNVSTDDTDVVHVGATGQYGSYAPYSSLDSQFNLSFDFTNGTNVLTFNVIFYYVSVDYIPYVRWSFADNNLPNIYIDNLVVAYTKMGTFRNVTHGGSIDLWMDGRVNDLTLDDCPLPYDWHDATTGLGWSLAFDLCVSHSTYWHLISDSQQAYEKGLVDGERNANSSAGQKAVEDFKNSTDYQAELESQYQTGYQNGKNAGYNEGINTQTYTFAQLFGAIADTPILILRNLLGFDVFGVNAMAILMSMLTGAIVLYLIKKIIL